MRWEVNIAVSIGGVGVGGGLTLKDTMYKVQGRFFLCINVQPKKRWIKSIYNSDHKVHLKPKQEKIKI